MSEPELTSELAVDTVAVSSESVPVEVSTVPLAIYFDGDDTLWDFGSVMVQALRDVRDEIAATAGVVTTVEQMMEDRDVAAVYMSGATTEAIRKEGIGNTCRRLGIYHPGLVTRLTDLFFDRRYRYGQLFDDTLPMLDALAKVASLGYLSNGNSTPDRVGLAGRFADEIRGQDHGIYKPDPAIFRLAESRLPAQRYVMVGDAMDLDIAGAVAAGWESVLLDRHGRYTGSEDADAPRPTHVVASLEELPALFPSR